MWPSKVNLGGELEMVVFSDRWKLECFKTVVPNLFGTWVWFPGRQFFHGPEWGRWFWDDSSSYIQAYLWLCGLVPNRPRSVLVCGLDVGDPCFKGEEEINIFQKK